MTKISDTAFLVNHLRSQNKELSGDIYSDLWIKDISAEFSKKYQREVNPFASYQLSLRHRFILTWIKKAIQLGVERIINIGAGFTTYSHLIEPPIPMCEVDYRQVIEYKEQKLKEFEAKDLIPPRKIIFIQADLNNFKDIERIKKMLKNWGKRSFAIFEGITFYLKKEKLAKILEVVSEIQDAGSFLLIHYWKPTAIRNAVFKKWMMFAEKHFKFNPADYTYLSEDYFEKLKDYDIIDKAGFLELERRYSKIHYLEKDGNEPFPENFIVLKK